MGNQAKTKKITAEELVKILTFTPTTYRVEMGNYGGEVYCGRVDRKMYNYFKENNIDLDEYASSWDDELEVPEDMQPFPPGSPYECDDYIHASGATMDDGNTIQVFDENNEVVWECQLTVGALQDEGVSVDNWEEFYADEIADGEVAFWGAQGEKGLLFGGEINLIAPFDPTKLKLNYADADGWYICNSVEYDGESIDNNDLSTTGKWGENKWLLGGGEDAYDPEDSRDTPEYGPSPDSWEQSPKFKFKQHKPVYQGWYSVNWCHGSTYGSLYWDGTNFVEFNYGKSNPVDQKGVITWQGYNWDTSSWVNQPPEPPGLICDNKACGWVGKGEDRIEDAEYNDHCPACNGTEFSWIDYDPDTKEGRKNREQYCKPWDPVESLEKIIKEFPKVEETAGETVAPKGSWPF